ncbi:hypothetical protein JCM10914A_25810 [Paenibacillus sp. JCM 10914]|uniref:hypothetical protein n=1 Tax=Paenibacillus sp. JCM 10914 TaxID=1236974 RepID=UPI0003CC5435|nr:hypothetical protein [Paenibacillus sp. JCM 10914]GAE07646.1 hypothetical protein JCM10914_3886 [Paenibacillus sp. JCM 10914]
MNSEKKTYYVSVNHNLIQEVPDDANEYVVHLNDEEVSKLRGLLHEVSSSDRYAFKRTFIPYKSADHDDANEEYDERTINLYNFLYNHGDEATRRTIEGMNIIGKLKDTGYDDPGYEDSPLNK